MTTNHIKQWIYRLAFDSKHLDDIYQRCHIQYICLKALATIDGTMKQDNISTCSVLLIAIRYKELSMCSPFTSRRQTRALHKRYLYFTRCLFKFTHHNKGKYNSILSEDKAIAIVIFKATFNKYQAIWILTYFDSYLLNAEQNKTLVNDGNNKQAIINIHKNNY